MVGRNAGYVTTQGEILTDCLDAAGYDVVSVSTATSRFRRLADIVATVLRRRQDVDIMVLQTYSGPSFVVQDVASALARRLGQRVVMHLHGGGLPAFIARHPRWARRVFDRADAFVAPSEFLADAVRARGYPARVIPNIVDLSAYTFRPRASVRPRLFWMRSYHPIYNPEMALRVLARVRTHCPDATLTMAGRDKGLEPAVRAAAARLGLDGAVRFVGFLDQAGKAREGEDADIFINTTRVDNTPVAIIEACAMGLPVVSTDVGGIRQLLDDGRTGLLVPDDDADAMADAVVRLVRDPALAARLSTNGHRIAERSMWDQVRPEWDRLFAEVLARRRGRGGGGGGRENGGRER